MRCIISLLFLGGIAAAKASDWEKKLPLPSNPLVWGEVNFLHTTDIHGEHPFPQAASKLSRSSSIGWLMGHQHVSVIMTHIVHHF